LADWEVSRTLAEDLVDVADCIRELYTDFGLRPYRVFLVWMGWTADEDDDGVVSGPERDLLPPELAARAMSLLPNLVEVGVGRPVLLFEKELLPTPSVEPAGISHQLDVTGDTEMGSILVTQISPRCSEDELMGLADPFRDPARPDTLRAGIDFFYEVRENRPAGFVSPGYEAFEPRQELRPVRRRFRVNQAPSRDADAFQWSLGLDRADGERGRDGQTSAMDGTPELVAGTSDQQAVRRALVEEDDYDL
jgi:hypothetical protein